MKASLFFTSLVLTGICMGCQEDENLNLLGYPENSVNIVGGDVSDEGSTLSVKAVYDEEGKLNLSAPLKNTWNIKLSTPSRQDAVIHLLPYSQNIPLDKIKLSDTELKIPAGYSTASVTVELQDEDLSFAEEYLGAQTYELGFKVANVDGAVLDPEVSSGKIVVEKEAYKVHVSMAGKAGNLVSMERVYRDGVLYGNPIEYSFKIQMDKPLKSDLPISFITEGISDDFLADIVFSPKQIVIPAGAKESELIEWSISDAFLKASDKEEVFDVKLKPVFEESEVVSLNPDNELIKIGITKTSSILELVEGTNSDWGQIERDNWGISLGEGWSGDVKSLVDNYSFTYVTYKKDAETMGEVVIDLQNELSLVGSWIQSYSGYDDNWNWTYVTPSEIELLVSSDNDKWESLGTLKSINPVQNLYIHFIVPMSARYIKLRTLANSKIGKIQLSELKFYSEK